MAGAGKSTAGNFLFQNKKAFYSKASLTSGTMKSDLFVGPVSGKSVMIIDTPGFIDTGTITQKDLKELSSNATFSKEGFHAMAMVLNADSRFGEGDAKLIQEFCGLAYLLNFVFLIVTHAKKIGSTEQEQMRTWRKELNHIKGLKDFLQKIENRIIFIESEDIGKDDYHKEKSAEFIAMIKKIRASNDKCRYTNELLTTAYEIHTDVEKIQAEYQNLLQKREEAKDKQKDLKEQCEREKGLDTSAMTQTEKNNYATKVEALQKELCSITVALKSFKKLKKSLKAEHGNMLFRNANVVTRERLLKTIEESKRGGVSFHVRMCANVAAIASANAIGGVVRMFTTRKSTLGDSVTGQIRSILGVKKMIDDDQ